MVFNQLIHIKKKIKKNIRTQMMVEFFLSKVSYKTDCKIEEKPISAGLLREVILFKLLKFQMILYSIL